MQCESDQGHYATEAMEKRVLDMQAKVMTQTCLVFIPRPIVDNIIQPEGYRMRCVMLLFLVVLLLIRIRPKGQAKG